MKVIHEFKADKYIIDQNSIPRNFYAILYTLEVESVWHFKFKYFWLGKNPRRQFFSNTYDVMRANQHDTNMSRPMKRSKKPSEGKLNIDNLLRIADQLVRQGRIKDAEQALERSVKAKTRSHVIHCKLGAVYWMQGNLREAARNYELALAINPGVADAHWFLGSICKELGDVERAIDHCLKALQLNPSDPIRQLECGNLLKARGRAEQAIEAYRRAVAIKPDYAEAYNNMGNAYMLLSKPANAITAYRLAYAANQQLAGLLSNLANALRQYGQYEEAEKAFREDIKRNPLAMEPYFGLGITLKESGRSEAAINTFEQAIAIDPNNPNLQNNLAGAYESMAEFSKAESHYLLAIENDNQHIDAMRNLAKIAKGNNLQSLKEYMKQAVQGNPGLLNDLAFAEDVSSLGIEFSQQIFGSGLDSI